MDQQFSCDGKVHVDKFQYAVFALLAALVLYQIYVSVIICIAIEYGRAQRLLQLLIVWLIPLFGSAGCHLILRSQRAPVVHRREPGFVSQSPSEHT